MGYYIQTDLFLLWLYIKSSGDFNLYQGGSFPTPIVFNFMLAQLVHKCCLLQLSYSPKMPCVIYVDVIPKNNVYPSPSRYGLSLHIFLPHFYTSQVWLERDDWFLSHITYEWHIIKCQFFVRFFFHKGQGPTLVRRLWKVNLLLFYWMFSCCWF